MQSSPPQRKGSNVKNLTVDADQANAINKTPSVAGDLIVSEGSRTPARSPVKTPVGLVGPGTGSNSASMRVISQNMLDAPETINYQRSKSDSRNMNSIVAPSPKAGARQILEDALREIEPMLPPIRLSSRDTSSVSRQPSRQASKDPSGVGMFVSPRTKSFRGTPRGEDVLG